MPETEEERRVREAVNDLQTVKPSDMTGMMDAGRSSQKERDDMRKEKEERERKEREVSNYRS